ncbi:MAG TPA: hypothetical protein VKE93_13800 [Candidatus Angelobacter sp.]|nr:hypothetical protein [Candidatus Angelobacter sp.]
MNRFKMLFIGALMTAGSALATAQPYDHNERGDRDGGKYYDHDRDHDRRSYGDRDDRRFYRDRDDRRFVRDRDDRRFFDRDDHRVVIVGERRFFNGYYWTWDGNQWCRRDGRFVVYFRF